MNWMSRLVPTRQYHEQIYQRQVEIGGTPQDIDDASQVL